MMERVDGEAKRQVTSTSSITEDFESGWFGQRLCS